MATTVDTPVDVSNIAPSGDDTVDTIGDRIRAEIARKEAAIKTEKDAIVTLKGILKSVEKQEKELIKKTLGKVKRSKVVDPNAPPREPSGITKPTEISDELAKFLGASKGTMMARTDVTKAINSYVKEHTLYDEQNKRVFVLDKSPEGKALYTLLGSPDMSEIGSIGYFNLQRYLKHHFISSKVNVEKKEDAPNSEPPKKTKKVVKKVVKKVKKGGMDEE
jgi:chromatin remodeling complex protein RSC6